LRVSVDGLPDQVSCAPADLAPGESRARLTLEAKRDVVHFDGGVEVSLRLGEEVLDRKTLALTVRQFLAPLLGEVQPLPIPLTVGGKQTVTVRVDRRGNPDPLTLEADRLPTGVTQGLFNGAAGQDVVGVVLEASPDATPVEGVPIRLVLKAD